MLHKNVDILLCEPLVDVDFVMIFLSYYDISICTCLNVASEAISFSAIQLSGV